MSIIRDKNRFRRVYSFNRILPNIQSVIEAVGNLRLPAKDLDLNHYKKNYDPYFFSKPGNISAVSGVSVEEDYFDVVDVDFATHYYTTPFLDVPILWIEFIDIIGNNEENINAYVLNSSFDSFTVGFSAPYTGRVHYRAIYIVPGIQHRDGYLYGVLNTNIEIGDLKFTLADEVRTYSFVGTFTAPPSIYAISLDVGLGLGDVYIYTQNITTTSVDFHVTAPFDGKVLIQAIQIIP